MLEIIALGSSLRALRCGKGGKAAGQDCHSSKERGKERLSPLATNQSYLPTICHRDFFSPILLLLFLPCSTAEDGDEV